MNRKVNIAAVGDNCIDLYNGVDAYPGGNPVNVSVYIKRLGGDASYTGQVGTDEYGQLMIDSIASQGVDTSHIKIAEGQTAITHVELNEGNRILGEYEEGVMSDFKLTSEDISFLASHDMVVSGIWGMIENHLPAIKATGVPVAFDFADKLEHEITRMALPFVDYAFFSNDHSEEDELKSFMKEIHSKGPKVVVVTRGEKGSIAYDGKTFYEQGIVDAEVVDTMGAGDSYIAGFLVGILKGLPIEEAMKKGMENSAITLGYFGAW